MFKFKALEVENNQILGLNLQVNPDYYARRPFIQDLTFRYYPDFQSAINAYSEGIIKGLGNIPTALLPEVLKQ